MPENVSRQPFQHPAFLIRILRDVHGVSHFLDLSTVCLILRFVILSEA
jgi:hypothetical protein